MYEVSERFEGFAAVNVRPKTGRTHQIRVHLAAISCPVLCDKQYGGRAEITRGEIRRDASDHELLLTRQALHARRISLAHPTTGAAMTFEAPSPADIKTVLHELRTYRPPRKGQASGKDAVQTVVFFSPMRRTQSRICPASTSCMAPLAMA